MLSENSLITRLFIKATDKDRFSVIEIISQPQSYPESLCAHECVFVVEEHKPHVFFRPCLVTAFEIQYLRKKGYKRNSVSVKYLGDQIIHQFFIPACSLCFMEIPNSFFTRNKPVIMSDKHV